MSRWLVSGGLVNSMTACCFLTCSESQVVFCSFTSTLVNLCIIFLLFFCKCLCGWKLCWHVYVNLRICSCVSLRARVWWRLMIAKISLPVASCGFKLSADRGNWVCIQKKKNPAKLTYCVNVKRWTEKENNRKQIISVEAWAKLTRFICCICNF